MIWLLQAFAITILVTSIIAIPYAINQGVLDRYFRPSFNLREVNHPIVDSRLEDRYVFAEFFVNDVTNASSYPEYEYIKNRPSVGICFSGGGSRSFEATLGYLRGLKDANLLKNIRYISSVSGGSWANTVFTYHDELRVSLNELLDSWTPPEQMNLVRMSFIHPKSARGYPVRSDLLANIAAGLLIKNTAPEEIWGSAIHETFLKPAGISSNSIPAWTRAQAVNTLARNQHLMESIDFRIPCSGRGKCDDIPFPIINSAMLGPIEAAPFGLFRRRYVMMESTPMYVGFPHIQNISYAGQQPTEIAIGGLVEPLGFGSPISDANFCGLSRCPHPRIKKIPRPIQPFGIVNATAASSWAPGALLAETPALKPLENVLITAPYFSPYWGGATRDVFVGDGANMENQGLIALLRRGVKSICMFINTPTPMSNKEQYHPYQRLPKAGEDMDGSVTALFGVFKPFPSAGEDLSRDHVFRRTDFPRVADALQQAQNKGKGAVASLTVTTVENRWWGIKGGRKVDVTFVYLGRVYEWEALLSSEVASLLAPHRQTKNPQLLPVEGMFKDFPHFPVSKLHLSAPEANALADMSAWVIQNNLDIFRKALNRGYRDDV